MNGLLDRDQGGQLQMMSEQQRLCEKLREQGFYLPLYFSEAELPASHEIVPVQYLLTEAGLLEVVDRVRTEQKAPHLAVAASLFQKRYASKLLASILTPMTAVGVGFLADAEKTEVILENGLPVGILLRRQDIPLVFTERLTRTFPEIDTTGWSEVKDEKTLQHLVFDSLFQQNAMHLIYHISSNVGLSPKVMWGNIGNFCAWLYDDELVNYPWLHAQATSDRHAVLNNVGYGSPLVNTYDMAAFNELNACARVRNTCCLWNQMPGQAQNSCVTCPRLSREERLERLQKKHG